MYLLFDQDSTSHLPFLAHRLLASFLEMFHSQRSAWHIKNFWFGNGPFCCIDGTITRIFSRFAAVDFPEVNIVGIHFISPQQETFYKVPWLTADNYLARMTVSVISNNAGDISSVLKSRHWGLLEKVVCHYFLT
jgi:predicted TIM-barrel fold metal-dependent hydrolase